MDSNNSWSKTGYNLEELYFEKINRELINQIKAKQKKEQGEAAGAPPTEGLAEVIPLHAYKKTAEKKAA